MQGWTNQIIYAKHETKFKNSGELLYLISSIVGLFPSTVVIQTSKTRLQL
jgi:hypothetical protein